MKKTLIVIVSFLLSEPMTGCSNETENGDNTGHANNDDFYID
jgi:hypothetical protein